MPDIFVSTKSSKKKVAKKTKAPKKKRRPLHFLASYCYYPENLKFVNQDPQEKVILFLRRHPITNVGWILLSIISVFAPLILKNFPLLDFLPARFQVVAILSWYLLLTGFVFEKFLGWFFNVYIVTDERVVDVDFLNLIYREITDANIDKIQDVTVQVGGVTEALFNYGNVLIQTASELPLIEFDNVPRPDKVSRILRNLRIEEEQEKIEGRVR
jgi:membrane protein YdbS with pleckstrin-like domain